MEYKISKNSTATGTLLGAVAPIIGFYLYAGLKYKTLHLGWLINFFIENHKVSAVLSLCLIMNLGVFYLFIWKKLDQSAKGVLFITILYAIIGFIIKFVA